jgi:tight adherence protein B
MPMVLGVLLGSGVFCVWWSFWPREEGSTTRKSGWTATTRDALVGAGFPRVSPGGLLAVGAGLAVATWVLAAGVTRSGMIALCLAILAARGPFSWVHSRARKRASRLRDAWPEAIDSLASGIRAGLSLPESLAKLGDRGPEHLRPAFLAFARDFRATGRFDDCLNLLKARLADPVADRIVESLRVTRDVGGSDLGRVLRALGSFLRQEAQTRGELEARQSWTVNAARLSVVAPWVVLILLSTRAEAAAAYNSPAGVTVLGIGALSTVFAYRLMVRVGRLPVETRVMR